MPCHDISTALKLPPEAIKVVLAGNPNVGKSVVFNALTGLYVDVSNYPGTTLEIIHGYHKGDVILDTPGVYGVSSFNDEEIVARDVILSADIVINVVDAVHLERDLFLTLQLIDMGKRVLVVLNMMDEARQQGLGVDAGGLERILGVPVVSTVAIRGQGIEELKAKIHEARMGRRDPWLEAKMAHLLARGVPSWDALMILEGDPHVAEANGMAPGEDTEEIYLARRSRVDILVGEVVSETSAGISLSAKVGRWLLEPRTGIPSLVIMLFLMWEFIGVLVAQGLVGFTEGTLMNGYYEPWMRSLIQAIPIPNLVKILLAGEFGVLTMTVTYLLGLLLPLVLSFYLALSILEDSGYLPRIATLVDRLLMKLGMNGRGVIPIILGFGCVTMATITTRLLGSDRERRIATFLLAMAIPCSAQLAVITAMLAGMGSAYTLMYAFIIFILLVVAGTLLNRLLPGTSSDLLIDLPPMRWPQPHNIATKTLKKTWNFLKEAGPLFAIGAIIIGILQEAGTLAWLQKVLSPLTVGWLQLPKETANAFIMGFVRRDFGAAGLYTLSLSSQQKLVALVTITIFVPCIASALVIFKERGRKEAIVVWCSILFLAFLVGGVVSQIII